jgi:hypothetical protein
LYHCKLVDFGDAARSLSSRRSAGLALLRDLWGTPTSPSQYQRQRALAVALAFVLALFLPHAGW